MTVLPPASDAKVATACANLGTNAIAGDFSVLMTQLVVALGNITVGGGGGPVAFSAITGDATDNASLVATFVQKAGDEMTGPLIQSYNGATETPAIELTGSWFTGGSATTTKPQLLIEPAGATSNNWSTSGAGIGVNAAAGSTGNLLDMQLNGSRRFRVDYGGNVAMGVSGAGTQLTINGLFSSGVLEDTNNSIVGLAIRDNLQLRGFDTFLRFISGNGAISYGKLQGIASDSLAAIGETGAVKFSIYGTADQTNYVRASITGDTSSVTLAAERAGSASANISVNILKAGTGNIILSALPTSDPGVSGALYTTAGTVMQSP